MFKRNMKVLVQGVTGKEAVFWVERMIEVGTNVVCGVSPGRGGESIFSTPIYDSVAEAVQQHEIDASILFVSPQLILPAAVEAIESGVRLLIVLADGVPVHDTIRLLAIAKNKGSQVLGPNTPGIVMPGNSLIGIMPSWLPHVFCPGNVGVVSRSGSLGNEVCYQIVKAGFGISSFVGIGGDLIVGTTTVDVLRYFEKCDHTEAVIIVGELGGNMEEEASLFVSEMTKPVIALIAGVASPAGVPMGHAGAIVEGYAGSAASKKEAFKRNGALVAETPFEIPDLLLALL